MADLTRQSVSVVQTAAMDLLKDVWMHRDRAATNAEHLTHSTRTYGEGFRAFHDVGHSEHKSLRAVREMAREIRADSRHDNELIQSFVLGKFVAPVDHLRHPIPTANAEDTHANAPC